MENSSKREHKWRSGEQVKGMRCQQVISILCTQAAAPSGFVILTAEARSIGQETLADATELCKVPPCHNNVPWNASAHAYVTQFLSEIYQQPHLSRQAGAP